MTIANNRPKTPIDYMSYLVFEDDNDWEERPIDPQERPITITFSSRASYDDEIVFVSLKPRVYVGKLSNLIMNLHLLTYMFLKSKQDYLNK